MSAFCYAVAFAVEQYISYMYFSKRFEIKRRTPFVAVCYILSFLTQYAVSFSEISELNLVSFFAANLIIIFLYFRVNVLAGILNTALLEGLMITSEIAVLVCFSLILGVPLNSYKDSADVLLLETLTSKAFYFFIVYVISLFARKRESKYITNIYALLLSVMPAISVIVMIGFKYIAWHSSPDDKAYIMFSILSAVLLLSNTGIFAIYEKTVAALNENTELEIEIKKAENDKEYYSELEKRFETGNILIHDIKNHLITIKQLSGEDRVREYIDSLLQNKELIPMREYSKNKLVNVIASRYSALADTMGIDFSADIRNINFDSIDPSSLTTILDNLLRNAVEAATKSTGKSISLFVGAFNENYIQIKVCNSCDSNPLPKKGDPETTKSDKTKHGYGIKSVRRILKRAKGNLSFSYSGEEKTFTALAVYPPRKLNNNIDLC